MAIVAESSKNAARLTRKERDMLYMVMSKGRTVERR